MGPCSIFRAFRFDPVTRSPPKARTVACSFAYERLARCRSLGKIFDGPGPRWSLVVRTNDRVMTERVQCHAPELICISTLHLVELKLFDATAARRNKCGPAREFLLESLRNKLVSPKICKIVSSRCICILKSRRSTIFPETNSENVAHSSMRESWLKSHRGGLGGIT